MLNYVVGLQSRSNLADLLQYLAEYMALLVQKMWEAFFCQNPALVAFAVGPLKNNFFSSCPK